MTSKQRAYLKSLAMTMDPIFQIGKASLTPEVIEGIREAIDKRELIKVSVLKTVLMTQERLQKFLQKELVLRSFRLSERKSFYINQQRKTAKSYYHK